MCTYWIKRHIEEQTDIIIGEHAIMIVNGVPVKGEGGAPRDAIVEFCGEHETPKTLDWTMNKDGTQKKYRLIDDEGSMARPMPLGS
jgi:hypothetical protein